MPAPPFAIGGGIIPKLTNEPVARRGRPTSYPHIDTSDIVKLRRQGLTLSKMAAQLGMSEDAVWHRLKNAGEPFRPAGVTSAQLAEFQHYADPAWEARNRIAKQVACRKCGRLLHQISPTHLRLHQMTDADYDRQYPDAPFMNCTVLLAHSTLKGRVGLEDFMAAGAARYLTPAEMADHLRDHLYEKHHRTDYIACRVCGFKSKDMLYMHLTKRHGYSLALYRDTFPGVEYYTRALREKRSGRQRKKYHLMGSRPKGWNALGADRQLIYMLLIEHPGITYAAIGEFLDRSARVIRCPYGDSWERVLRDKKAKYHGAAVAYIWKIEALTKRAVVTK